MLQSIRLLADAARSFADNCVVGIRADEARIRELMERSLMLVTALAPTIGYERAAAIAKAAHANGTTLREEALRLGYVSAADFDRLVRPEKMTRSRLSEPHAAISLIDRASAALIATETAHRAKLIRYRQSARMTCKSES